MRARGSRQGLHLVEWRLLALVLLALAGAFWRYAERVQAQAELAAVRSTLGALRTTLVLKQLREVMASPVPASSAAPAPVPDPFEELGTPLSNYHGPWRVADIAEAPPGGWVFDAACACIGYRPRQAGALEQPDGALALWFRVGGPDGTPPLAPIETYIWLDQRVQ